MILAEPSGRILRRNVVEDDLMVVLDNVVHIKTAKSPKA